MSNWEKQAKICRDIRDNSIPKQWLLESAKLPSTEQVTVVNVPSESRALTPEDITITESDVSEILEAYKSGKWTVRQVVTAFLKKAVIINQLTNFVTEFLADDALQRADELDAHFKATGQLVGPLHGIPTSVKEHIALANRITNAGFVSFIQHPLPTEDAHLVTLLKKSGAVFHVRTNQPQSLMHLDCENNITGRTLNPYNLLLSPGGSSGGEGVSLGSKCSVLGIGTDIGGSIRIPAAFNNTYGLRPTALRIPTMGNAGLIAGQESIRGVAGPLAQSVEGLQVWMKTVLEQEPWDFETSLMPVPWRSDVALGDFTVGVMWDDGIVKPHPPVLRALKTAAEKLKAAGVKVVDWEPYDHQRGWDIIAPLYFPDGGQRNLDEFNKTGEPALPLSLHAFDFANKSGKIPLSVHANWALNYDREQYRRQHHALMKERGVDFILGPTYVGAGVLQGGAKYWGYTSIWNILDLPSAVLPSGLVCDKNVDVKDVDYKPRNETDEEEWKAYDPELFHGFPIALQIAGKRYKDEEVLAASKVLDAALKGTN
ncbi:hypothetical protein VP1G_08646 [Cytospora mali]|uniref:amidase n=1 Tax=Cytospora mali TaxID=578113 RepID=A0A194VBV0_CYTMA|nr:hypothetical protein VP1G_08646 [Valsa mali var. pyri (nom. inval.)]